MPHTIPSPRKMLTSWSLHKCEATYQQNTETIFGMWRSVEPLLVMIKFQGHIFCDPSVFTCITVDAYGSSRKNKDFEESEATWNRWSTFSTDCKWQVRHVCITNKVRTRQFGTTRPALLTIRPAILAFTPSENYIQGNKRMFIGSI